MSLFIEMLIFAVFGLGIEVVFTAASDAKKGGRPYHLMGYSSIWYMPLYMLAPVFFSAFGDVLFPLHFVLRGLIYMASIFLIEFCSMFVLRKLLGSSPSQESYYQSGWSVFGLIRLDFAPVMFTLGLILEFVFRSLH